MKKRKKREEVVGLLLVGKVAILQLGGWICGVGTDVGIKRILCEELDWLALPLAPVCPSDKMSGIDLAKVGGY